MILVELRRLVWLALLVVAYGALDLFFFHLTTTRGLITPSGSPSFGLMALGLAVMLLRIVVLVVTPATLAYRAVFWIKGVTPRPMGARRPL